MEAKEVYRGTKSDFHTHVHDLPPQLGGCQFGSGASEGKIRSVNGAANLEEGVPVGVEVSESAYAEPRDARLEIVYRVARHWKNVQAVNPYGQAEGFDVGLRCVLTGLLQEQAEAEGAGAEGLRAALAAAVRAEEEAGGVLEIQGPLSADAGGGLRYVRDRVSIPRDMTFYAGRRFRHALEATARTCEEKNGTRRGEHPIPTSHRKDTDPRQFARAATSARAGGGPGVLAGLSGAFGGRQSR
mmetsp:Transcript_9702/g.23886  ORF Transcript_9702/g.23886 Transcript_9702/m.23886 type:complete len:242 (+) Transcript_9702:1044-1769(+)